MLQYNSEKKKVFTDMQNNKGSDEWFENPLDSMPIANGSNRYASPERMAELEEEINPRPEEEAAEWFKEEEPKKKEEEKTIHQKMYEIATSKYNPFAVGGSESLGGGSEERLTDS